MIQYKNTLKKNKIQNKKTIKYNKNKNKNNFFIHIPKTAGETIKDILVNYNYKHYTPYYILKFYKNKKLIDIFFSIIQNISKWHIPVSMYNSNIIQILKNKYNFFAIVRNPYNRVISDFNFWISFCKEHKETKNIYHKKLIDDFKKINPTLSSNFETLNFFIQKCFGNNYKLNQYDGHHIPMHYYTHIIDKKYINHKFQINKNTPLHLFHKLCNHILFFENLNEDFNKYIIKENINIPQNILVTNKKNNSLNTQLSIDSISKESKKILQNHFYFDFILFNYSF